MLLRSLPKPVTASRSYLRPTNTVSASCSVRSPSTSMTSIRSFWNMRRASDYSSHLDPTFVRHIRFRTLRTRAKMLDKLRRRGRWNWDASQRPFFSSKQIRLASHLNGRPKWAAAAEEEDESKTPDHSDQLSSVDKNAYEFSQRERVWKSQMDALRKRIEQDPYEAVLGERFEPFWSPLVPSWMREEMGLQGWHNSQDKATRASKSPSMKEREKETLDKEAVKHVSDPVTGKPCEKFTYTSTTSWDSWSSKARREEWDSVTGRKRYYEYDPISNRMVQVEESGSLALAEARKPGEATSLVSSTAAASNETVAPIEHEASINPKLKLSDHQSDDAAMRGPSYRAAENSESPTAAPMNSSQALKQGSRQTQIGTTPAPSLDSLTAANIRAQMGKSRQSTGVTQDGTLSIRSLPAWQPHRSHNIKQEWEHAELRVSLDTELEILMRRKSKLLQGTVEPPHTDRRKRVLRRIDEEISSVSKQLLKLGAPPALVEDAATTALVAGEARAPSSLATLSNKSPYSLLQPSIDRLPIKEPPRSVDADDSAAHESTGDPVQVAQGGVPRDWDRQTDLLQTSRVERTRGRQYSGTESGDSHTLETEKPEHDANGSKAGVTAHRSQVPRWIDEMTARKAAYDAAIVKQKADEAVVDAVSRARLLKAQTLLDSEVDEQKTRMAAFESKHAHRTTTLNQAVEMAHAQNAIVSELHAQRAQRSADPSTTHGTSSRDDASSYQGANEAPKYQDKIRELRADLDRSFKQSSSHAEMHMERIATLEAELAEARGLIERNSTSIGQDERQRYLNKISNLKEELDRTFRQSSVQSQAHVERIRALEKDLEDNKNPNRNVEESEPVEAIRGEGDFCANVTKYAKSNERWYKRPAFRGVSASQSRDEAKIDNGLTQELRAIYERHYGAIDCNHVQPVNVPTLDQSSVASHELYETEPESDLVLDKALEGFDQVDVHSFKPGSLEAEIAAQEKKANEAQQLEYDALGALRDYAIQLEPSLEHPTTHDGKALTLPEAVRESVDYDANSNASESSNGRWKEPPTYKVLTLSGDRESISVTSTSSKFTSEESILSLSRALSKLSSPAPFVPHIAELQRAGYQVVHAARDLLVLRQARHESIAKADLRREPDSHITHNSIGNKADVRPISLSEELLRPISANPDSMWDSCKTEPYASDNLQKTTKSKQSTRVHRKEDVYSGARLGSQQINHSKRQFNETPSRTHGWRHRRRTFRARVRWALGVGFGTAAIVYAIGAIAERKEAKNQERWRQILDGKKARWE